MSTLPRADSNKRPVYKDYVTFLESYKNGKKDDQHSVITNSDSGVCFSLTSSSNNSSSSLNSDLTDCSAANGYNSYVQNLNNKKFAPVKTEFAKTESKPKTVKTEVYIQIQNNEQPVSITKTFSLNRPSEMDKENVNGTVNKMMSKFEEKPDQHRTLRKQNSIKEISKKFEETAARNEGPVRKPTTISQTSKVFQGTNQSTKTLPPKSESKVASFKVEKKCDIIPPPPQFNSSSDVKNNQAPVVNNNNCDMPPMNPTTKTTEKTKCDIPAPPKMPPNNFKLPPVNANEKPSIISPKPVLSPQVSVTLQKSPQKLVQNKEETTQFSAPPPPPPPPANFCVKATINTPSNTPVNKTFSVPVQNTRHTNGEQDAKSNTDFADGKSSTLDKNDPRVKKIVYGAMRGWYGAYHDKANDYIATLPKNMVKKNNGLDNIINSIALQGGLDKLNGRVNPNPEQE